MSARASVDVGRLRGRAVVRAPDEEHRASTPLELFFDLTFVVAVGRAAAALDHELLAGHVRDGLTGFVLMFFAVWWAWMNFTWFASAHDSDDVPHRLLTLVQMAGVLVLSAGVTAAVEDQNLLVVTIGYGIMRLGLVASWLRVARDQPAVRQRALRFAGAITALQLLWFARLALPGNTQLWTFAILALAEVSVPVWAERAVAAPLYHPEHIEERYGLFTLIVLGESLLSAAAGFQTAVDDAGLSAELLAVGLGGLVMAFSAWWLYFDHPGHLAPTPAQAFRWGYAHVMVFAALAAMGAGLGVAAETVAHDGDVRVASMAVAVPAAGFLAGVAVVMTITGTSVRDRRVSLKFSGAALLLIVGLVLPVAVTVLACAAALALLATGMVLDGPSSHDRRPNAVNA